MTRATSHPAPTTPARRPRARLAALVITGAMAVAAGCSSSSTPQAASSTSSTTTTTAAGAAGAGIEWSPTGTWGTKPTVVVPSGSPPAQLQTHDLIVGTGATAQTGQNVTVQYVGYSWTNRKQFDASWDRGQPLPLTLAQGQVITGWVQGVPGMKVGGRRELIIPPSEGYGASSPTPAIAANDTLIFVVDLVKVG